MAGFQSQLERVIFEQDEELLSAIHREFFSIKEIELFGGRNGLPHLQPLNGLIEEFYLIYKFRIYLRYQSYDGLLHPRHIDVSKEDFQGLLELADSKVSSNSSNSLRAFYEIAKMVQRPYSSEADDTILQIRETLLSQVQKYERLDLLTVITNWMSRALNHNVRGATELLFDLYTQIINDGFGKDWEKWHHLPLGIFKNVVQLALNGKYEFKMALWKKYEIYGINTAYSSIHKWCDAFIQAYKGKLSKKNPQKEAYIQYCRAYNVFVDDDIISAYEYLCSKKQSKYEFINLDYDMLLMICIYSLEEYSDKTSKKVLRKYSMDSKKILDRYRKKVEYEIEKKEVLGYQTTLHATFAKSYAKLRAFRGKYTDPYRNDEINARIDRDKITLSNFFDEKYSPPVRWLKKELSKIT